MKAKYLGLLLISVLAVMCCCKDDNDEDPIVKENLSVDFIDAYITEKTNHKDGEGNVGAGYIFALVEPGIAKITIEDVDHFYGNGHIFFIMLVSSESSELLPGEYTFQNENFTFPYFLKSRLSYVRNNNSETVGAISEGTVKVSKSGTTYRVEINVTIKSEKTVTTFYEGELKKAVFQGTF